MASRQLNSYMALPAGTRPMLRAAVPTRCHSCASIPMLARFSTARVLYRPPRWKTNPKHMDQLLASGWSLPLRRDAKPAPNVKEHVWTAAFRIPDFSTSSPAKLAPAEVHGQFSPFSLKSSPDQPLEDSLFSLFTKPAPTLHFSNPDFYHLRKNTRVPEVCIIGRSNVGKSSLVNAVANRTRSDLARVSKKAGHTQSINVYGIGPAPRPEKGEVELSDEFKGKEEMPSHQFFLVDMPGYGFRSREEWGKHISLYLQKRRALKGAVMLIDAIVGPKPHDWDAVELMASAGLRTAFVLTKADKLKGDDKALLETCKKVWGGIRRMESRLAESNKSWTWEKEVYVTALGAVDVETRRMTTTSARLAIARLAGLVNDTRPEAVKDQKWSGKIVSFEELFGGEESTTGETATEAHDEQSDDLFAEEDVDDGLEDVMSFEDIMAVRSSQSWVDPSFQTEVEEQAHTSRTKVKHQAHIQRRDADLWKDNAIKKTPNKLRSGSIFARRREKRRQEEREREARDEPEPRMRNSRNPPPPMAPVRTTPLPGLSNIAPRARLTPAEALEEAASRSGLSSRNRRNQPPPQASFFHTTSRALVREERTQPHPLSKQELNSVMQEFIQTLSAQNTPQDQSRQRKLDMERGVGQLDPEEMKAVWAKRLEDNKKQLARRFSEQSKRVPGVIEARLKKEEEKLARQAYDEAEKEVDWREEREQRRPLEKRLNGQEFDEDDEAYDKRDEEDEEGESGDDVQSSRDGLRRGFRANDVKQTFAKKLTKKEKKALKAEMKAQSNIEAEEADAFEEVFKGKIQPKKKSQDLGDASF